MTWKRHPSKHRWGEISSWTFMFSLYLLLSYTSYQSKGQEIGTGRAVSVREYVSKRSEAVSVSLKSHQVSYLQPHVAVCSIIPQPSAFQWLCLFSCTPLPGVTGCTPTASPSTPESFPLKQIPPCQTYSKQADSHIRHTAVRQSREGKVEEHQECHRANSAPIPGEKEQVSICRELPLSAQLYQNQE